MTVDELRVAAAVGVVGLLLLIRFDAARFGAAEYDPGPDMDTTGALVVRAAWPILTIALSAVLAFILPGGMPTLGMEVSTIDTARTLGLAIAIAGLGVGLLFWLAWMAEGSWPPTIDPPRLWPRAALNAIGAALVDEIVFRGILLAILLAMGVPVWAAFMIQLLTYGLATRLGASAETLPLLGGALVLGAVNGWLVLVTGGIVAPLVVHAVVRFAAIVIGDGRMALVPQPVD
jgi:hypothetical protein